MSEAMITIEGLKKRFGDHEVLKGIDLRVDRGSITTIIGKSGTGKSVMLKCIAGILQPDAGRITIEEHVLDHYSRSNMREARRHFSYMFQNNALFDSLSVFENVSLPLVERFGETLESSRPKVAELFMRLDLDESIFDRYPSQISGGMQKRVALARALVTDPKVVLFDEPTTGLDPVRKSAVYNMIERYQEGFGFTALVVSHDIPDALCISHRVAVLDQGEFRFQGPPEKLAELACTVSSDEDLRWVENLRVSVLAFLST